MAGPETYCLSEGQGNGLAPRTEYLSWPDLISFPFSTALMMSRALDELAHQDFLRAPVLVQALALIMSRASDKFTSHGSQCPGHGALRLKPACVRQDMRSIEVNSFSWIISHVLG